MTTKKSGSSSALIFRSKSILLAIPMYLYTGMNRCSYIIPLVLILAGTIGIGQQLAHATNESDYRFGYKKGLGEYGSCFKEGCQDPSDACNSISNFTACLDGWRNGHMSGCESNLQLCFQQFRKYGELPDGGTILKRPDKTLEYCVIGSWCGIPMYNRTAGVSDPIPLKGP